MTTCFSGIVNDTDLCLLGEATEEKLSDVLGMWVEETDSLYDNEHNSMTWNGNSYRLSELCEIVHATTAEVLAEYESDFYKGTPALTRNLFGKGVAYHLCSTADVDFYRAFFAKLCAEAGLEKPFDADIPEGVGVTEREGNMFLQSFCETTAATKLSKEYTDIITGEKISKEIELKGYSYAVIRCDK